MAKLQLLRPLNEALLTSMLFSFVVIHGDVTLTTSNFVTSGRKEVETCCLRLKSIHIVTATISERRLSLIVWTKTMTIHALNTFT